MANLGWEVKEIFAAEDEAYRNEIIKFLNPRKACLNLLMKPILASENTLPLYYKIRLGVDRFKIFSCSCPLHGPTWSEQRRGLG
jgi:hypothetical protein